MLLVPLKYSPLFQGNSLQHNCDLNAHNQHQNLPLPTHFHRGTKMFLLIPLHALYCILTNACGLPASCSVCPTACYGYALKGPVISCQTIKLQDVTIKKSIKRSFFFLIHKISNQSLKPNLHGPKWRVKGQFNFRTEECHSFCCCNQTCSAFRLCVNMISKVKN